ncbi:centromere protein F-like [Notothenia coriiceps]|uniref:Centromere protein F-like n=1 Tax=Notothenia coriiceps TaxID=8208 RepID=A0A6I9MV08_9TELE|nr:PREDICTED: centromere protein F-like [Notothenia coriiceps]
MGHICVTGDVKSSDAVQLKEAAEQREKEVEDLKSALQQKKVEAEEKIVESQQKSKEVEELKAALDGKKKELEERNGELQEMKSEFDELNQNLEEKSKEADESIEKYCSVMLKVHKLEETNDSLTIRLEQLTASRPANESNVPSSSADATRRRRSGRKSYSKHPEEKLDENTENMAPLTLQRSPQGKRAHRDISNKDSAQEALHNLTKKIKANAVTTAKPKSEQEDDEFRPEGLPELVQRGFGDIPLGEASPFIMRRTTVKRCSPRLAAKQTVPSSDGMVLGSMPCLSPNGEEKSANRSLSVHQTPEKQEDNCHVQ